MLLVRISRPQEKKQYNGGIERFKIEKHGYGLKESGLIAFVQKNDFSYWFKTINTWIEELSTKETNWSIEEKLSNIIIEKDFSYSNSSAKIDSSKGLLLHHFWISVS